MVFFILQKKMETALSSASFSVARRAVDTHIIIIIIIIVAMVSVGVLSLRLVEV